MNTEGLSINLATVRQQWNLREAVEACVRHGIRAVDPWRDQVASLGLDEVGACHQGQWHAGDRLLPRRHVSGGGCGRTACRDRR